MTDAATTATAPAPGTETAPGRAPREPASRPSLAIFGAGPVGLDAALAAAEAGLPFTLYEAGDLPAAHVRAWGHVRLFSPWELDVSPRMRRCLQAAGHTVPAGDACPTGSELVSRVLDPVAASPQIAPRLRLGCTIRAVGREGLLKHQEIATAERAARRFRFLVRSPDGDEQTEWADVVLDCTGTYGQPNALGESGIPAPGEERAGAAIDRHLPDLAKLGARWAGSTVLVVGGGHSAQTAVRDLAALAADAPGTRVLWALPEHPLPPPDPDDPLPERRQLGEAAQALAGGASAAVEALPGARVQRVARRAAAGDGDGRLAVTLARAGETREVEVDRVLSLTGYVGDLGLHRQLQVHQCYATEGPMKLSAALLAGGGENGSGESSGGDCLSQASPGPEALTNPEPGFFVLGVKSYGRHNAFLMRTGWQQVDDVFSLLVPGASAESA